MLSRRQILLAATATTAFAQQPRKQNVLLFLTDQESARLPGPVRTPNRDRLRNAGVDFSNAFCNTPQCSPARSAILSGLYPHKAGVLTNVDGSSLGKGLPSSRPTIGTLFKSAGYSTGYFGKWHLGGGDDLTPFGFTHSALNGSDTKVVQAAAAWIREQKQPWMAIVSILNPHHIYSIPKEVEHTKLREGVRKPASDLRDLAAKPTEQMEFVEKDQGRQTRAFTQEQWLKYRSFYCTLVEEADACLGTVLSAVDLANTTVVYSTDHGDQLGEHGLPYKGPFMYEELLRIPLTIAGPGARSVAGRKDELVMQADYAPTLAGLAGLRWKTETDGVDLTKPGPAREHLFLEYYAKQKWKNPIRTIRTRRFKFNWYNSGHQELYDLRADPHETRNLAADPAHAVRKRDFEAKLNAWRAPIS
ncbi:MAG: sulfatase-like hydrolase/transferase [Acidobacteria bacterium]|nr:sulfatase-like hydrolase/transferase [Acidobacteriota bacterium]